MVTYGDGVTTNYTYSNSSNTICPAQNFRLCTLQTQQPPALGGFLIQNLTYGYDKKGNVNSLTDPINGNQTFGLDEMDRLTTATGPYGTVNYAYDTMGDILCNSSRSTCSASSPNYTYGSTAHIHAVTSAAGMPYNYDANGNMIMRGDYNLSYDYENRLISSTTSPGSSTTTMIYNGKSDRVSKTVNGTTTVYAEKYYECIGSNCVKYIFAGNKRIAVATVGSATVYYYHTDHLKSSSSLTDSSGNQVESISYNPFGSARSDTGSINTAYKFNGKYFDSGIGLYYYGARYYDPILARFIQADTYQNLAPQGLNRYSYALNNPVNFTDPTGHFTSGGITSSYTGNIGGNSNLFGPNNCPTSCGANSYQPIGCPPHQAGFLYNCVGGTQPNYATYTGTSGGSSLPGNPTPFICGQTSYCITVPSILPPTIVSPGASGPTQPGVSGSNAIASSQSSGVSPAPLMGAGFGLTIGATAEFGKGNSGVASTASIGCGVFWGGPQGINMGCFYTKGSFIGGLSDGPSYPPTNGQNSVAGIYGGWGGGPFYTPTGNSMADLNGPFNTTSLNTELGGVQISGDGTNSMYAITVGPGYGFSFSNYQTDTASIGTAPSTSDYYGMLGGGGGMNSFPSAPVFAE